MPCVKLMQGAQWCLDHLLHSYAVLFRDNMIVRLLWSDPYWSDHAPLFSKLRTCAVFYIILFGGFAEQENCGVCWDSHWSYKSCWALQNFTRAVPILYVSSSLCIIELTKWLHVCLQACVNLINLTRKRSRELRKCDVHQWTTRTSSELNAQITNLESIG